MKSSKIHHSKEDALNHQEVKTLLKATYGQDRFILVTLLYGGLRVGELIHMRRSWIHINDEYAEALGGNHIKIPGKGPLCDCVDCQLSSFIELESKKEESTDTAWHRKKQKEFYERRRNRTLPKNLTRQWSPKSRAGVRTIPILFPELETELLNFFTKHKKLNVSRQHIWRIIKRISKDNLGSDRVLYPHAVRATCATLWADVGLDVYNLQTFMGWDSLAPAEMYVNTGEKKMMAATFKKKDAITKLIG